MKKSATVAFYDTRIMLKLGLYEQVINRQISHELDPTDKFKKVVTIDAAEAAKILAKYLAALQLFVATDRDAMDYFNYGALQGLGVKYFPEKKTDVFFVTLNKSDKEYSPTTMYNDYSINEWLFHWQSQSTTSAESVTGQRYIHHRQSGNQILLFARESKKDSFGNVSPYTFLGLADYIKHEGSRPMNITWKLQTSIPAKFLKKTNKLVVG